MSKTRWRQWFTVVSAILVLWGVVFTVFGLGILPVARDVLLPWESALYGAIMLGWGTTLLFVGRVALDRRDAELLRPLLVGIAVWLVVEAGASIRFGVWFNVAVDVGVLALFGAPLLAGLRPGEGSRRSLP
jgi:hypothetical protein